MREYQQEQPGTASPVKSDSATTVGRDTSTVGGLLKLQRNYGNRYVQRLVAQRRKGESEAEIEPEVEAAITRSRGGGQALDGGVRVQMERAFGADFGGVRVHTGTEAHRLNESVNAIAFTTGRDIFFRESAYNPGSSAGRELLAHELTHVVQQGGSSAVQGKLVLGAAGDRYEREADSVAREVVRGIDSPASAPVQRQCACGGHTASGDECPSCRQKRGASPESGTLARNSSSDVQRQDDNAQNAMPAATASAPAASGSIKDVAWQCLKDVGIPMLIGRVATMLACLTPLLANLAGPEAIPGTAAAVVACLKIFGLVVSLTQIISFLTCFFTRYFGSKPGTAAASAPPTEQPA
jgi:hypothetical protein